VLEPFERLIRERQLLAYRYDGFWLAVDTAKDKQRVDDLFAAGNPPWEVWNAAHAGSSCQR
jgi:glucose-1-phosphate cytidylyltransferase